MELLIARFVCVTDELTRWFDQIRVGTRALRGIEEENAGQMTEAERAVNEVSESECAGDGRLC